MTRTATTKQVAAALRVGPATVRKYAREGRVPFDATPGGHRRFDVQEAVAAILGHPPNGGNEERGGDREEGVDPFGPVPYVPVRPVHEVTVTATVTGVEKADVVVYDGADDVEAWAAETIVV